MNIFVIPSWYPSDDQPSAGIFFREQALLYARHQTDDRVGIVHWGQNDNRLLLTKADLWKLLSKVIAGTRLQPSEQVLAENCVEYYRPMFTWTRSLFKGNIDAITQSCRSAFTDFTKQMGKPDLIHAHVGFPGGYIAWQLSQEFGVPYLITEHMGPFPFPSFEDKRGGLSHWLKTPLQQAHKVLAVSTHLQQQLQAYGITSRVFHNYIDEDAFRPGQAAKDDKKRRLLHIGRLAPEKRQVDLLKALTLLPSALDYELELIGEGPLREDITRLIQEYNLESRVRLLGQKGQSAVLDSLQRADLLILSSDYENFPVSILEALACGTPVVATRCGGPEEMIVPANGLLANPHDPQDLAKNIMSLLGHIDDYDPHAIRADFESRFGSASSIEKLRKIYEELAALSF